MIGKLEVRRDVESNEDLLVLPEEHSNEAECRSEVVDPIN